MKKIKNTILSVIVLSVLILSGCDHDDFLTEVNPNAITSDTFWKTQSDAHAALTTVYAALQFQAVSGGQLQYEMAKSDLGGTNDWTRHYPYTEFSVSDSETPVLQRWSELYMGVYRANQVINNIPTMDVLEDDEKELIVAQARFLRAFFYFDLVHTFGEAVLTTASSGKEEDVQVGLSTIKQVTDSVIVPDLIFARTILPNTWEDAELGRVTWGAATALLGKSYLYNEDWDNASKMFLEVINSGLYSLVSDPLDNFNDVTFNSESIFEVPFDGSVNAGTPNSHYVDDNQFNSGGESTSMSRWFAPYSLGGWQVVMPTYWLHELMTADSIPGSTGHSSRYTASVAGRDAEGLYYGETAADLKVAVPRRWTFGESSYVKKYTNWYHLGVESNEWRSSINFKHIRLADVYLMYAEAVLQKDGSAGVATAIDYIDRVRARAGVVLLQDYIDANNTIPQLHISMELYGTRPEVAPTADNIMTHLRMVERPTELCYENLRWKDLVRWGIVASVFDMHHKDEVARTALGPDPARAPLFIEQRIRPDFVNNYAFYNSDAHDYFPIPATEVQTNEAF
ncbi:RagB/SusD family nutrient uptake outer membrane protein [Reichenbachiella carrageenanivorans]|uniref:RagB/SusD family nutrient uptake outer membrane protein n=1 Tax=Reichenbachiella carrageenanivorans TaxID=2979869 RepID=A0ABY6D547_9BACT|nr:RagB/SusD family nutrient uptake outer membrane protein [Reichenbachiella carrageenanivorans]UXX81286.1 RagB/SusD family nutrient uptake outer membrane protein [Reichenbachiella carrageenanivorans]